ncbi:hypothetical protein LTR09_008456 [Extremus antarcticus]|uniref:Arabinan endo-1,5-alpha-L-arabinosidase n=1 Tax=Extremus antarcticus TaxID=702011 RepID=A0AAJ0DHE9_9PEZI|nr:hypothetical protein LTR09_008456 [Extremus antarcticus]
MYAPITMYTPIHLLAILSLLITSISALPPPSLARATYFRFSTGSGLAIHTSPALTGPWTYVGEVLPSGSSISNPGAQDAWAPDVHEVDGVYYCYYSVSSFGTQESVIGVATSSTMEPGSWTDHGSTGLSSTTGDLYNAIDANPLPTSAGENVLTFGSFWGDIFQTPLNADLLTVTGASPYQIEFNDTGTRPSEGGYVVEREGYSYLFFSSGVCCGYDATRPAAGEEYKIMVCRSSTVDGEYVDAAGRSCLDHGGTLVLGSHDNVYGPGGQGVYEDPEVGTVLYYHYVDTNVGYADGDKQLGINVIDWSLGWPVV